MATAALEVQAALFATQTRVESNVHAAVAAVPAEVDARRAWRAGAEAHQANVARSAAAIAAAPAGPLFSPAASMEVVSTADERHL